MAPFYSPFDSISPLHDITTQAAAGTRSSHLSYNMEDVDEHRSMKSFPDYDDESLSFCSSGTLSTSLSLTSLSSFSSISEDVPTRLSSSQEWSFDGAWSIEESNYTPKLRSPVPPIGVHINDDCGDPAEHRPIDSPVRMLS